jgi:hypothetical protein
MMQAGRARGAAGVAVLAAIAVGASGCGSGGGAKQKEHSASSPGPGSADGLATSARGSTSLEDGILAFARCMREHGIDMADPKPGPGGGQGFLQIGGTAAPQQRLEAANSACQALLPKGPGLSPKQIQDMAESSVRFARCMREHGVDLPDPKIGGDGSLTIAVGGAGGSPINPTGPAFQKAQRACAVGDKGVVFGSAAPVTGR